MITFPNPLSLVIMSIKEAKGYERKDCKYCVRNMKIARQHRLRCIVDTLTRDVVGVCV
jgi:hypothetical protein